MSITELPRRAPRPLPPMPFEPRSYREHAARQPEPELEPVTWWDRTADRILDWLTPARFWGIYGCLIVAVLLAAWVLA